jgi:predicted AAA+ superfamily ATPase
MDKSYLKNVIVDQREEITTKLKKEKIISRDGIDKCRRYIAHPNILLISGMRRSGKSFFSHLLADNNRYAFLNFDDERLIELRTKDFNSVMECFCELYDNFEYILFDEIQNIKGWELFVSRLRNKHKVIISGSNANLLSKELATHLTGRYIDFVLFPLSFKEFLRFNGLEVSQSLIFSTQWRSKISGLFDRYLKTGGIFEYYKFGKEFLRNLWLSIITKDICLRYKIKYPLIMEELSLVLLTYFGSKVSVRNLTKHFNIKSPHTISQYIRYLENSFLFFTINKFSYKIKEQLAAFKKIYVVDNGFINALSFQFSENIGRALENLVAVELKRKSFREGTDIFYWDNYHTECDFIVKKGSKIINAYQVCREVSVDNEKREVGGLVRALEEFGMKSGIILTESSESSMKVKNIKISLMPIWKWLLESEKV